MRCWKVLVQGFAILMGVAVLANAECNPSRALGERPTTGRILFDRGGGELWVMNGDGSHQHHVLSNANWSALNPDGVHILYWDGKAIRSLSLQDGCDTVVDDTLQSPSTDLGWSGDGRTLGYVGTSRWGSGLHVLPFPISGTPRVFAHFNHVALSRHGQYAITVSDGLARVNLATGERTRLGTKDGSTVPWGATYLGGDDDTIAELVSIVDKGNGEADVPDCRGGNTALRLLTTSATVPVVFPQGFTSTLEYEFDLSPDRSLLAVSFGADRCDYPGDVAAVYLFSLRDHTLTRVSPKDRLAGRVKFSPDGRALIYTDFKGTGTTAIYRYDISAKQLRQLTVPRQNDYDYVIDWR